MLPQELVCYLSTFQQAYEVVCNYYLPGTALNVTVGIAGQYAILIGNTSLSYAPPALYNFAGNTTSSPTDGGTWITLNGTNFVPVGVSAGGIEYSNITVGGRLCQSIRQR